MRQSAAPLPSAAGAAAKIAHMHEIQPIHRGTVAAVVVAEQAIIPTRSPARAGDRQGDVAGAPSKWAKGRLRGSYSDARALADAHAPAGERQLSGLNWVSDRCA